MRKDPKNFRERFKHWKETGEYLLPGSTLLDTSSVESSIPYPMLTSRDYDDARAYLLGYFDEAGATGHLWSNDRETGRILKSPTHPTISKAIWGDMSQGYDVINNNGLYYSKPSFIKQKIDKLPGYVKGKPTDPPTYDDETYKRFVYTDESVSYDNTQPLFGMPDYDVWRKIFKSDDIALKETKYRVDKYPNSYHIEGGTLPTVTVTPDPNYRRSVRLDTYYPLASKYTFTGHSSLDMNLGEYDTRYIDMLSSNPNYNIVTNNCSDATRKALEYTTGKKLNPFLFTTPGDVKDFAEDELNGFTINNNDGSYSTYINLPLNQLQKLSHYIDSTRVINRQLRLKKK